MMRCKITNQHIKPFMSFGKMPIANAFLKKKDFNKEFFFNLEVGFSNKVSLFQLNDHPKPKQMFNSKYPFFTSSSVQMIKHFKNYANWIKKNYLKNFKNLIEIGSNDGTFLKNFEKNKYDVLGFEPSSNVAKISKKKGIKTINDFFNYQNVKKKIKDKNKKIDVIVAANAICHIPDLKSLIKGIDFLLTKNGLFIFEEPYLGSMFKKGSYDQIYDEHIFMFSAHSVKKIFNLYGFELIDAIKQKTHGGSMRYVVARKKAYKKKINVNKVLQYEIKNNINNLKGCLIFKKKCELSKNNLIKKLEKYKKRNLRIAGYAATSKSTTILNYCNIGTNYIDYISDTTLDKIGKYSPGMHIPIVPISHLKKKLPDKIFLFAWNHKKEIFLKEKNEIKKNKWFAHVKL